MKIFSRPRLLGPPLVVAAVALAVACAPQTDEHHHQHDAGSGEADKLHAAGGEHGHTHVDLPAETLETLELRVEVAAPGPMERTVDLPGKVVLDEDRLVHVTARFAGVVASVGPSLGDTVEAGEVLAVLDSAELAEAKSALLTARAGLDLAEATLRREESLHAKGITSEQELLEARRGLSEARIAERAALQRLLTLGVREEIARALHEANDTIPLSRFEIRAPSSGRIIERHITRGESVEARDRVFTIADLSRVWVDLSVYQHDLPLVREGQDVQLETDHDELSGSATISFVQPIVDPGERTALARIVLDNASGEWHPGCFVTGRVATGEREVAVRVERSALQRLDEEETVVFVPEDDGFATRLVKVGETTERFAEILEGLAAGEHYVAGETFALKAELLKDTFGDGHGH